MKRVSHLLAVAAVVACSDGLFKPTEAVVPGSYTATAFVVTDGKETVDWYARGARIELYLYMDHTTAGRLFAPGAAEGGGDEIQDLAGTWVFTAQQVHLSLDADTFMDDLTWAQLDGNRLIADRTLGDGTRVHVALGRFFN